MASPASSPEQHKITGHHDDGVFGAWCLSFGMGFGFLWLCFGALQFQALGHGFLLDRALYIPLSIGLVCFGIIRCGWRLKLIPSAFAMPLLLYTLSDAPQRGFSFLLGGVYRGELCLLALIGFLIWRQFQGYRFHVLLALSSLFLLITYLRESQGGILFSDDHASFLYRLILLQKEFPHIPFYNPFWNAGFDARDFFATGALNFFLIFSPVFSFFAVEQVYTILVGILLFCLLPCSLLFSARLLGLSWHIASLAGLFSLGMSLVWYRWALHFGTLGFITSATLSPLCMAFAARAVLPSLPFGLKDALLASVLGTLCLLWSPIGLVFLPAFLFALVCFRSILRKHAVLICILALCVLNLPWISVFWSVSRVSSFVQADHSQITRTERSIAQKSDVYLYNRGVPKIQSLEREAKKSLREFVNSSNPAMLFFAIVGCFFLPKPWRALWTLQMGWLLLLGTYGKPLYPQLDLERMLLVFALFGCIPAALVLHRLNEQGQHGSRLGFAIGFAFASFGILSSAALVQNRTAIRYGFLESAEPSLARDIKQLAPSGRVLFPGFVLHEWRGGHLAPLAHMTGAQLVATSPVHNQWRYREQVPGEFLLRKEEGGIEEYFDLMNAELLIAHEKKWKDYLRRRPEIYEEHGTSHPFVIFRKRNFPDNFVLEGNVEDLNIEQSAVTFVPRSSEIVLRFQYFPFLEAGSCSVFPKQVSPSVQFVELKDCPVDGRSLRLASVPAWERVALERREKP